MQLDTEIKFSIVLTIQHLLIDGKMYIDKRNPN